MHSENMFACTFSTSYTTRELIKEVSTMADRIIENIPIEGKTKLISYKAAVFAASEKVLARHFDALIDGHFEYYIDIKDESILKLYHLVMKDINSLI